MAYDISLASLGIPLDRYNSLTSLDARYLKIDGSNANTAINIGSQDFTTSGSITALELLTTAPTAFTYNGSGQLTQVAKTGGSTKTLAYNGDGTLNTINDGSITKTFNWAAGVLQSISIT